MELSIFDLEFSYMLSEIIETGNKHLTECFTSKKFFTEKFPINIYQTLDFLDIRKDNLKRSFERFIENENLIQDVHYKVVEEYTGCELDYSKAIADALGGKNEVQKDGSRVDVIVNDDDRKIIIETKMYDVGTGIEQLQKYSKVFGKDFELFLIVINPINKAEVKTLTDKYYPEICTLFGDDLFFDIEPYITPTQLSENFYVTPMVFIIYLFRHGKVKTLSLAKKLLKFYSSFLNIPDTLPESL
jgi:hypothetical protein